MQECGKTSNFGSWAHLKVSNISVNRDSSRILFNKTRLNNVSLPPKLPCVCACVCAIKMTSNERKNTLPDHQFTIIRWQRSDGSVLLLHMNISHSFLFCQKHNTTIFFFLRFPQALQMFITVVVSIPIKWLSFVGSTRRSVSLEESTLV